MLFNSYSFIVFFVPVVYLFFRVLSRLGRHTAALLWLTAASFFLLLLLEPSQGKYRNFTVFYTSTREKNSELIVS